MAKLVAPHIPFPAEGMNLRASIAAIERGFIDQALKVSGTRTSAAELLGMSKQALNVKLKKHFKKK